MDEIKNMDRISLKKALMSSAARCEFQYWDVVRSVVNRLETAESDYQSASKEVADANARMNDVITAIQSGGRWILMEPLRVPEMPFICRILDKSRPFTYDTYLVACRADYYFTFGDEGDSSGWEYWGQQ